MRRVFAPRCRVRIEFDAARSTEPYLPGILAHCRWPLGTNLVEGINNKIKVIKRMAYGFRDDAYFFLKIRAALPDLVKNQKRRAPPGALLACKDSRLIGQDSGPYVPGQLASFADPCSALCVPD